MRSAIGGSARLPKGVSAARLRLPRIARYVFLAAAVAGALYALLLARAEWLFEQDTARSVPEAAALVPYNATYLSRLGSWQPAHKRELLERAVRLNPFDYQSLIQLGYLAEFEQHDPATAEHDYLRAEEVNRMFLPKWTLTNFYYRHGRTEAFFRWATATLAITPYAPEPVFTDMWEMSSDPERIARAIPERARTLLAYAWFLSNQGRIATLPAIVERLIAKAGNRNPRAWGRDDLLAAIEDRLLGAGEVAPALRIWTALSKARWIPFTIPTTANPITNSDFSSAPYRHGFDWVPQAVEGIRFDPSPLTGTLRIEFSGNEPESCVLLRQYVPVQPGGVYDFSWKAEPELAETPSGLTWHLRSVPGDAESAPASPDLAKANKWETRVPANSHLAVLSLEYVRPLGHLRARGAVVLKTVEARLH